MTSDPEEEQDLYELINQGLAHYHDDKPFEAHEVWEFAWGAEVGRTKLTLQVIILVAAALYKHATGNPRGTSKLFAKAIDKLDELMTGASAWLGIDLVGLKSDLLSALAQADAISNGERGAIAKPHLPRVVGPDGIIYLHGFASGASSQKGLLFARELGQRGFFIAMPDQNEGDFEHFTISRALSLAKRFVRDRTIVVGSSLGGYIGSLLAAKDDRVRGLVLMAPAFDFALRLKTRYTPEQIETWRTQRRIDVEHHMFGGQHPIDFGLLEDAERHPGRPPIRVPTYILHGRRDDVVPTGMISEIAAKHPGTVELELVDDDHSLTTSAPLALRALNAMLGRFVFRREPNEENPRSAGERATSRATED